MKFKMRLFSLSLVGLASPLALAKGGATLEKSCLAGGGSSAALMSFQKITCAEGVSSCAKDANKEKTDFKLIEGVNGPELQIGKVKIFLDPTSTKSETRGKDGKLEGNNSWCIVDPDKNKEDEAPIGKAVCGSRLSQQRESKGNRSELKSFVIPGTNLKITPTNDDNTDPKSVKLVITYGDGQAREQMIVSGLAQKQGLRNISKMTVRTQSVSSGNTTGVIKSEMSGILDDTKSQETGKMQFSKCESLHVTKGQLNKKEDQASETYVGLNGQCFTMRGSERYSTDVMDQSCKGDGDGRSMDISDERGNAGRN